MSDTRADFVNRGKVWFAAALGLSPLSTCPIKSGQCGIWLDSNGSPDLLKFRLADGTDIAIPAGQEMYAPVDAVSTSNIAGTYSAGVFTVTATGALTVDGVTASLGKRILLQTQTTTHQQGIYIVTTAGAVGVSPVLTRASDMSSADEFTSGALVYAKAGGSSYGSTLWGLSFSGSFTVGTTTATFSQFATAVTWAAMVSAATTSGGTTLSLQKENNQTVNIATSTTSNTAGGNLTVTSGAGVGTAAGGTMTASGGAGGATGAGGAVAVTGGAGGATSGTGGAVTVAGGAGTNGNANGGAASLLGGAKNGSGVDGAVNVGTSNTSAVNVGAAGVTTTVTGNLALAAAGLLGIGTAQALSGAGAVDVTHVVTKFTSTGGAQALTLADGSFNGQVKIVHHTVDGGSGVLTPTTAGNFATFTFTNVHDACLLMWNGSAWDILLNVGGTVG